MISRIKLAFQVLTGKINIEESSKVMRYVDSEVNHIINSRKTHIKSGAQIAKTLHNSVKISFDIGNNLKRVKQ